MSSLVELWAALVFPSSFVAAKYLGWPATAVLAMVAAAAVVTESRVRFRLSTRMCRWLALITVAAVVLVFAIWYPRLNTRTPGVGSDDDDSINVAARALMSGHFPYSVRTYLGNADHHLTGALLLAAPFVLLGTSALQNLLWLPLFFLVIARESDEANALRLAWFVLLLSPSVMYEVVTGTGYISNAISVALGLWWVIRARRWSGAAAVAWGVTLASRPNFLLVVPVAVGYLRQHRGWPAALRTAALTSATVAVLTVPFYVHDPSNFTPLEGANRLLAFDRWFAHAGTAALLGSGVLAAALAFTRMDDAALFRNAAVVQMFPVAAGVAFSSLASRSLDLTYARYGAFFAWFAFLACTTRGTMHATPQCPRPSSDDYGSSPQAHGRACT